MTKIISCPFEKSQFEVCTPFCESTCFGSGCAFIKCCIAYVETKKQEEIDEETKKLIAESNKVVIP